MIKISRILILLSAITLAIFPGLQGQQKTEVSADIEAYCSGLPFEMPEIRLPSIPQRTVRITDHGAVGDGQTLNTGAFSAAIHACAAAGGGTVLVPPGVWRTGPIQLASNINLHIARGAVVLFSKRFEDYPLIQRPGSSDYSCASPIFGFNLENISITGQGTFDGSGEAWRPVKKEKLTEGQWKELINAGGVVTPDGKMWWPSRAAMNGAAYLAELKRSQKNPGPEDYFQAREFLRPDMLLLMRCRNILIDGPVFQNSPRFTVHPVQCEDMVIRGIEVRNPWWGQNADGIDLSSCRNVLLVRSSVDAGDDAICLKPGALPKGVSRDAACENIVVADCTVYHGHGGFVIGSETYGGARNVSVKNCFFSGTDVGLRFKSARGRGGLIEKIFIEGIRMRGIANEAILFDSFYENGSPEANAQDRSPERRALAPVTARTPRFQNFQIKKVVCNGAGRAILLMGLPESKIRNIRISDVVIEAAKGALLLDTEGVDLNGARIISSANPIVSIFHSRDIRLTGMSVPPGSDPYLQIEGEDSDSIQITGTDMTTAKRAVQLGPGVRQQAVKK